jgi:hypothetical protein
MNRFKTSLVAAAVCGLFLNAAQATTPQCAKLSVSEFAKFERLITEYTTASAVSNAGAGAIPFDLSSYMTGLTDAWKTVKKPWNYEGTPETYKNIDLTVNPIPDYLYGSFAPYGSQQFGYEMNWRISHMRYWAGIGVFYNRSALSAANTMNANGKTTAQLFRTTYDAMEALHSQAEKINKLSVDCMGSL